MKRKFISTISTALLTAAVIGGAFAADRVSAHGTESVDGGIVHVNTALNVRSMPSTSSAVKAKLSNGDAVTLRSKVGDWWSISYFDGLSGYVYSDYIEKLDLRVRYVKCGGGNLNVRSGPDISYDVVDKLPDGSEILVLEISDDFVKALYNGSNVGYVARKYLVIAPPDASYSAASYTESSYSAASYTKTVSLDVPVYRQYDARWAKETLPGSGEGILTHGCAVTSLAMVESYRSGTAIVPSDILDMCEFTNSGAVYWPTGYYAIPCTYSDILKSLSEGKPVIVHGKTANGTTHFAVVCGYNGGGLNADSFLINDPGTYKRTTLAQFAAVYTSYVKALVY